MPPLETRRSGRRSAPSLSASLSKSPDSDNPQEDIDRLPEDPKLPPTSLTGKPKRKLKDKPTIAEDATTEDQPREPADDEEEQGITRCVCGSTEDDPDAGEFMVQCETCKVWQHGLCMGYQSEDQVHDDDYYCEMCRPELHVELLKRLAKRPRQTSTTSHKESSAVPRVSRSHSPTQLLKQQTSKRRNTMNSRDAAFDEKLKEIIEATAAEAAAVETTSGPELSAPLSEVSDSKKKRKRTEDDSTSKKRTRSASEASDRQSVAPTFVEPPPPEKLAPPPVKPAVPRAKRGGRKVTTVEITTVETEEGLVAPAKKPGNNPRAKGANTVKRPPISQSISGSGTGVLEHSNRRSQAGGASGSSAAEARAYRQTHAYAVSQQALYTSWNLPDYLTHLEELLPSNTPMPLEVRSGGPAAARGETEERTMERGVKVKWPAKRMSVGDMNKRVRALVEWVGREQASALDRGRRREALEKALREYVGTGKAARETDVDADDIQMVDEEAEQHRASVAEFAGEEMSESALDMSGQTMKMMEELMEELIGFQERFGPGAKRERRQAAT